MKTGMDYKIDIKIIHKLLAKYSDIENKVKKQIKPDVYTSSKYLSDLANTTTLVLSKAAKNLNNDDIEKALTELIEIHINSFSFYSNTRRCVTMSLLNIICNLSSYKKTSDLIAYITADTFLDTFGKFVFFSKGEVNPYEKLITNLSKGKRNISRQGLVLFAIAAKIYNLKELDNLLNLCGFEILDKNSCSFDYFICSLLQNYSCHITEFSLYYEKCVEAFKNSPQYTKAKNKTEFYIDNFPIHFNCLTTEGYR